MTTATNLQEMRKPAEALPVVKAGFFDAAGFELMQRVAKAFAASTLVPQQFQGNVPNCMIALNLANRMRADELMVMQNLYIVHGRPGWSAKFLIATFNQCGRFSAIRYEFFGERGKDSWGARAYATELSTGEKVVGPEVTIQMAKDEGWFGKNGSKWKTIPELMLRYRSGSWLVNTAAPEISMGLPTAEELHDVVTFDASGNAVVTTEELRGDLKDITPPSNSESPAETSGATASEAGMPAGPAGETSQQADQQQDDGVPFAKVADSLQKASDLDVLDVAADLINAVKNPGQQEELRAMYHQRREQLENLPPAGRRAKAGSQSIE